MKAEESGAFRWCGAVHPEDARVTFERWRKSLETGTPYECEHRLRGRNRRYRWFLSRAVPVQANGRVRKWLGTSTDIDDLKHLEERLALGEARYKGLFDNLPDRFILGQVVNDSSGKPADLRYLAVNRAFTTLAGVRPEDVVGRTSSELSPGAEPGVYQAIGRVAASGRPALYEMYSPGSGRHYECHGYSPAPGQFAAIVRDITERKRAEQALMESEERFKLAIESTHLGLFDLDPQTGRLIWSDFTKQQFGPAEGEPVEYSAFLRGVHPDDREMVDQAVQNTFRPESDGEFAAEFRTVGSEDGRERWVAAWGRTFFDAEQRPVRFIGVWLDVDMRKRMEEQLFHAQKMESVGVLAAGLAHDFNNLLTIIQGNAGLLYATVPPECESMLDSIHQATERAAYLTQELLAYAGKGMFMVGPVDLARVLRDISPLLTASIPPTVSVRLRAEPSVPLIQADRRRIQQLVRNLVVNASEAVPDQRGTVYVRTFARDVTAGETIFDEVSRGTLPPGRYVCIEVRDTGCGMDEATKARIFEPFFTTRFAGRGLGLAAAAGIVKTLSGAIEVETAPGEGSTFRVYFRQEV